MAEKLQASAARCPYQVPFSLQIESGNRQIRIACRKILRYLPGKRLVCDGEWDGRRVIVKLFLSSRKGFKHCLREEQGLLALQKAGLASPGVLFKGTSEPEGQPVLVLEYIDGGQDCKQIWDQAGTQKEQEALLFQIVRTVAELHKWGLYHQDMHLGNFMRVDDRIYTLDGAALASGGGVPVPQTKSIKNLAKLFAQFPLHIEHLFPSAFREYAQKRSWNRDDTSSDQLAELIPRERHKREQSFLKKIFRESTAFTCRKTLTSFWACRRLDFGDQMAALLQDPDLFMQSGRLLKDGNSSTVAAVHIDGRELVIKRYNIKNVVHGLKRCLRPSRAWTSWRNAHRLSLLGLPTPKPVAFLEKRLGPLRSTAYYITEFVPGKNVQDLVYSHGVDWTGKHKLIEKLQELLISLHQAFIVHGDMKATNFIVAAGQILVTDLDAMKSYTKPGRRFIRNQRKDWKRFQKNWQSVPRDIDPSRSH